MSDMIGQTISHYKILAKLGEGGMGVVYQAEDLDLHVTRALKFLPPHAATDDEQLTRLQHEARAAAALEHPNICQVHEIGRADGQTFIVMSYLEGQTLEDRLAKDGLLPLDEAMKIATEIGDALSRAHTAGIVHRDIKPANIMLTDSGQTVVMDFGLAKSADLTKLTKTGTTLGTAAYMSPEQAGGQTVDARSDVWSLGVVLNEMLIGQPPFGGDNLAAIAYAIQHKEPEALTRAGTGFSSDLEKVVDRALAKDPHQRYQTADELMEDLVAVREDQELARKTARYDRRRKLKRRKQLLYSTLAAILVLAVAVAWWVRHQNTYRIDALAVLPFANLSGDEEQEYFSDGMTEDMIMELQQLAAGQLRVIGRTSVMSFKGSDKTLPQIAAELGVDAVVEASVIRSDDLVKVAAKLIRARPQEQQMWAETYERNQRDIASLYSDVARAVAEQVQLVLAPGTKEKEPVDPEAYDEYLIGSHIVHSTNDVFRALPHFERAMDLDPSFAPAFTAAAHCKIMPTHAWPFDTGPVEEARQLVEKAIELDPNNAESYFELGHILYEHDFEMKKADEAFQRAAELNPSHGLGLLKYAFFLTATGRFEEAADLATRAIKADPFDAVIIARGYAPYLSAGRTEEFLAEIDRVKKINPAWDPTWPMSSYHAVKGEYDVAIELYEKVFDPEYFEERHMYTNETYHALFLRGMAELHWCAGDVVMAHELARQWLEMVDIENVSQPGVAEVFAILGDFDSAIGRIEKAYNQHDIMVVRIQDPGISRLPVLLADDPRYEYWLKKIGLKD